MRMASTSTPRDDSRVASVSDAFGFVAEQIGKLKIGAISYPLTAAPNEILTLGATGDLALREDV